MISFDLDTIQPHPQRIERFLVTIMTFDCVWIQLLEYCIYMGLSLIHIYSVREGLNFFRGPDKQHQWRVSRILCCQLPA